MTLGMEGKKIMTLKGVSDLLLMNQEGLSQVKASTSYLDFPNFPHMLASAGLKAVWASVFCDFLSPGLCKDQIFITLGRKL